MTWDVIGQDRAVAILRRAVEDGSRLSHAYLFVGPEHVGRATAARQFAQALNCQVHSEPPTEVGGMENAATQPPCGACRSCRLIGEGKHPDVEVIAPGGVCDEGEHRDHEGSRDIRICQVRRLESLVSRAPFEARYRVLIVDPADTLTAEAANAFLKTLEEPPPRTVLVLLTAREDALRETVRSRCRRIAFSGVPRAEIESALRERWGADEETAARLARLAQGRLGWAVSALSDEHLLEGRERMVDEIESLAGAGYGERFGYAAALGRRYQSDQTAVADGLELMGSWWRDVLLTAAGKEDLTSDSERLDTLRSHAAQYGVAGAVRALRAVEAVRQHLDEHASPTLALEVMLLELPQGWRSS